MAKGDADKGKYISEWFGHRIYPIVVASAESLQDQPSQRCPFLSAVKNTWQECIKPATAKGVCTVSAVSNGPRQDWVVCPYRVFDAALLKTVVARLYGVQDKHKLFLYAGPTLAKSEMREAIPKHLADGERVLVYFDDKVGGEISLSGTSSSPQMAFDVTFVEVVNKDGMLALADFAIVEVQTMDFHGSYKHAVTKLRNALDLHANDFPVELQKHPEWASEQIEGPNIANVAKRTLYQMMFKFNFGLNPSCAGTALVIPESVWDSWQPFLASPSLGQDADGTFRLDVPGKAKEGAKVPAWIFVFEFDVKAEATPSPIAINKVIAASPDALEYYAVREAPRLASVHLMSEAGIYATLRRRLRLYWPEQKLLSGHVATAAKDVTSSKGEA